MDLDSYIARYTGESRLKRLLSIAVTGGVSMPQRQRALLLAERQMRRDRNALLYKEFFAPGEVRQRIANPTLYEGTSFFAMKRERIVFHCVMKRILVELAQFSIHRDSSILMSSFVNFFLFFVVNFVFCLLFFFCFCSYRNSTIRCRMGHRDRKFEPRTPSPPRRASVHVAIPSPQGSDPRCLSGIGRARHSNGAR